MSSSLLIPCALLVMMAHLSLSHLLYSALFFSAEYKGTPDPLRGDEIYRRVREAAKEALDAIFDSQQPVTSSNPNVASRIQGTTSSQWRFYCFLHFFPCCV